MNKKQANVEEKIATFLERKAAQHPGLRLLDQVSDDKTYERFL